jgi:chaperonin GroEL
MRILARNAGEEGSVIIDAVRRTQKEKNNTNHGYNVMTGEFIDLVREGIIDPVKVTRSAVQNAISIAALILTTNALIADVPEEKPAAPMPGGGGMDF